MSLGAQLTLSKDSATDVDTNTSVFDLRAADLNRSEYSVAGLTFPAENKLTIGHEVAKGGEQRKMIRNDETAVDALLVPATASVYLVIVRPASTAITNTLIKQCVNRIVDFLIEGGSNANVDKVLNGEV